MHRITKQLWEGPADSAQQACSQAGWLIGDCWVRERTPMVPDPTTDSGHAGDGWRNITKKEATNHE
jgi:hypothetical protein